MTKHFFLTVLISLAFCLNGITQPFSIEIYDNSVLEIIDSTAKIEVVAGGFTWTEGPVWVVSENCLLFSDIPRNRIYKLDSNGDTSLYLTPSGFTGYKGATYKKGSNALAVNSANELIIMQHGDRRIAKMNSSISEPKADYTTLIDSYQGKRLNSPNDISIDKKGNIYFTDPPYGLPKQDENPDKELSFNGVYCLLKSGKLILLDSKLTRPNGLCLSKDNKTLYVAVSDQDYAVWYKYQLAKVGKVKNKELFYNATEAANIPGSKGLPDGMKVHSKGFIIATGPGGVWIFNSNAEVLARIYTGQSTSNCALSSDEKFLFLTADDYVLRVSLKYNN